MVSNRVLKLVFSAVMPFIVYLKITLWILTFLIKLTFCCHCLTLVHVVICMFNAKIKLLQQQKYYLLDIFD